ncbi:MAG TPA: hypothetical protein VGP36_19170 [Mycobacteriales bacterium]|nr:hypothetical protein [Mycobacteriales bacterium]
MALTVRPDDEVYQFDTVWLGPDEYTLPIQARYVAWGTWLACFLVAAVVLIPLGGGGPAGVLGSLIWSLGLSVVLSRAVMLVVDHERPLRSLPALFNAEARAALQARRRGERSLLVRPGKIRVRETPPKVLAMRERQRSRTAARVGRKHKPVAEPAVESTLDVLDSDGPAWTPDVPADEWYVEAAPAWSIASDERYQAGRAQVEHDEVHGFVRAPDPEPHDLPVAEVAQPVPASAVARASSALGYPTPPPSPQPAHRPSADAQPPQGTPVRPPTPARADATPVSPPAQAGAAPVRPPAPARSNGQGNAAPVRRPMPARSNGQGSAAHVRPPAQTNGQGTPAVAGPAAQTNGQGTPAAVRPAAQTNGQGTPAAARPAAHAGGDGAAAQGPVQHPAHARPAQERPESRPAAQHPAQDRPAAQHPAQDRPAAQHPAQEGSAAQHSAHARPADPQHAEPQHAEPQHAEQQDAPRSPFRADPHEAEYQGPLTVSPTGGRHAKPAKDEKTDPHAALEARILLPARKDR